MVGCEVLILTEAHMKHPLLYQINTRILLQETGVSLGRPATLDDVPDALLDEIAERGFDWVWFLGVWQTGEVGIGISRSNPELRASCTRSLPDVTEKDICGSPFAVQSLHRAQGFRWRCGAGAAEETFGGEGTAAGFGFCAEPRGSGPPLGAKSSRVFHRGNGTGSGP